MKTLLSILKGIKNGLSKAFIKVKSSKRLQGALVLVCIVAWNETYKGILADSFLEEIKTNEVKRTKSY